MASYLEMHRDQSQVMTNTEIARNDTASNCCKVSYWSVENQYVGVDFIGNIAWGITFEGFFFTSMGSWFNSRKGSLPIVDELKQC